MSPEMANAWVNFLELVWEEAKLSTGTSYEVGAVVKRESEDSWVIDDFTVVERAPR